MNAKPVILVTDDDMAHRTMLKALLGGWGYDIVEAEDGSSAIEKVRERSFDLILMDIRMIRVSGIEALDKIKAYNPAIPVIIMTAYSSIETAIETLKKGAYDYLTKPLDFDKLRRTIHRAMEHIRRLLTENLGEKFDRHRIIGSSLKMTKLLEVVAQVAASEATVIIRGESGTGKEMIASVIHFNSPRKNGPFVRINCAAITETLIESELFGHEKGAFTGADRKKEGKFVLADGGTLFLDEVSEMSMTMQAKLLRVIQEREIMRVGGEQVVSVDVRVITATNKNLKDMIREGNFREDLYYRLNVVELLLPPLRERREDIPLLAQHFLQIFAEKNRKTVKGFSPAAMDALIRSEWQGNVRELMNAVERAVVLSRFEYLDTEDFPMLSDSESVDVLSSEAVWLNGPLDEMEKTMILKTLDAAEGNKSEAARRLGITRKTLRLKLKKYGVADS